MLLSKRTTATKATFASFEEFPFKIDSDPDNLSFLQFDSDRTAEMPVVKFQSRERSVVPRVPTPEGPSFWAGFSKNPLATSSALSMAGSRLDLALMELTNMSYGSGFLARCEG